MLAVYLQLSVASIDVNSKSLASTINRNKNFFFIEYIQIFPHCHPLCYSCSQCVCVALIVIIRNLEIDLVGG